MQTMLSIFEPQTAKVESSFCEFCGEFCSNDTWKSINHGIIFNGWCVKAMIYHNQVHLNDPERINWLVKHNIDPYKSRFEQSA